MTLDKIFERCIPIPFSGCWIWTGPTNGKENDLAHGKMWFKGKCSFVHRVVYELVHGRITKNMHIHHECSVRLCCNPDHLTELLPIHNHLLGRGTFTEYKTIDQYENSVDPFELVD